MFDAQEFARRVREKMALERASCRKLEQRIGVSHATISRVARGHKPDVDTFAKLERWLNDKPRLLTNRILLP